MLLDDRSRFVPEQVRDVDAEVSSRCGAPQSWRRRKPVMPARQRVETSPHAVTAPRAASAALDIGKYETIAGIKDSEYHNRLSVGA